MSAALEFEHRAPDPALPVRQRRRFSLAESQPDGTYADARVLNLGETLHIAALPGVLVPVDHVFNSRRGG